MPPSDIDDNLVDWTDLVSVEAFSGVIENLNYLIDCCPVGAIVPIAVGLSGVPAPDPSIWQEAVGDTIEEQLSNLRGQAAPDMRDRYLKCPATEGAATPGNYSGNNTKSLNHNHNGFTTGQSPSNQHNGDTDGSFIFYSPSADHFHPINNDLTTVINFEPPHVRVRLFLKIR